MSVARVVVFGAGRVGGLIATDLGRDDDLHVEVCDVSERALERVAAPRVHPRRVDLSDAGRVAELAGRADVAVGAVPGAMGRALQRAVLGAGTPLVDISFGAEDASELDALARERGVPAIVDCGVAPGLSNWFVGRSVAAIGEEGGEVDEVEILVGGLPFVRRWPYEYRSVFSPTDVIEEYTRPCRMRVGGRDVIVPALTGVERVEFDRVGTLEAFNTDGLRSLLDTVPAPTMREKTLRYPGHADRMAMLRETGFFDDEPLEIEGVAVRPRALTERLMFAKWEAVRGDDEFTVLRVTVRGRDPRGGVEHRWDLFDRTDRATGATSMARTTGFPCAIAVRMVVDGAWRRPGVSPPEILGADAALTARMLEGLAERGVAIDQKSVRRSTTTDGSSAG